MPSNRRPKDSKSSPEASSPPNNETDMAESTGNNVTLSELTRALGELRVAISEDLKATLAELDSKIESTIRAVASQGQSIVDLEKASEFNAGRIDELEKLCTSLQDSVQRLSVKVVDLEGRSRRHNLRLVGLAEGVEAGSRPTDFFAKLLRDAMGSDVLASDPQLDRAHRALVPVPGPGQRPRSVIICCHSFKTKDLILREARLRGNLLHKGHPFRVYEDYAPDVAKHRAGYREVMTKLYKLHLRPALLFPARLRITPPSGLRSSLQRMQLEYVDVVFANRPDSNTPMEEIVRAMTHLINNGMSMYWGTSRWSAMEIMEAYSVARQFNLIPPVCEQAEYHFFQRDKVETQLPELYHKIGVGVVSWSPLACGIITGKYENGIPECSRASMKPYAWLKDKIVSEDGRKQQAKLKELTTISEKLGCTLPQLAIAWCLRNEGVSSVLLGTSNPIQLAENLRAMEVIPKMTAGIATEIDHVLGNQPHSKKDFQQAH